MNSLEKELEKILKRLGCKEITSNRQRNNGTTAWELPWVDSYRGSQGTFRVVVAEYESGMVRNVNECFSCYQLNSRKPKRIYLGINGETNYISQKMILLPTRSERLARLVSYVINRINK